jgi:LuxR family quorum-sensing transcriptional regulator LasR
LSLHFIEQMAPLLDAADEAEWFRAIAGLAETWGFDRILIAMLPRPTMRLEDAYIRSTYAPAWRQTYDKEGLVHIDPTVEHCMARAAPLIWSPAIFSTTAQQSLYEEARSYGLRAGVTVPIHGPNQEAGMMCFVNDNSSSEDFQRHVNAALPNLA